MIMVEEQPSTVQNPRYSMSRSRPKIGAINEIREQYELIGVYCTIHEFREHEESISVYGGKGKSRVFSLTLASLLKSSKLLKNKFTYS